MARKIIDIGIVGNDGTGDSIRDSFRKVNENFRELYSSLGLGEKLTLGNLDDLRLNANTPSYKDLNPDNPYFGQENKVLSVNEDESGVALKEIRGESGVSVDFTNNSIVISSEFSALVNDPEPKLGGDLSTRSFLQHRIINMGTDLNPLFPIYQHEATSKGYVDTKISRSGTESIDPATGEVNTAFGTMTGPLILSRDPRPDDDEVYDGLIAATKRYVDNSGFGSKVNLYVAMSGQDDRVGVSADLQGRALPYAYRTLEAALKKAEEIMLESRQEIGPYKKVLTYNEGQDFCILESIEDAPNSGSGFIGQAFCSVDTFEIANPGQNYTVGDVITVLGGSGTASARFEVLSVGSLPGTSKGPVLSLRLLSSGVYSQVPPLVDDVTQTSVASPPGVNLTLNLTYKVNNVEVIDGGSGYGLVSVRITNGGGRGAFGTADVVGGVVLSITVTDQGSGFTSTPTVEVGLPRFRLRTDFQRTDFTGDVTTNTSAAIRGRDIREGLFLRGEESGALAQILAHTGELDSFGNEIFDVDIKFGNFIDTLTRPSGGERISYGDVAKETQITILVESGIYYENLPLRVPANVSIVGDEFRRVIVRPKPGVSSSPWSFLYFRRDLTIGGPALSQQVYDSIEQIWETENIPADTLVVANRLFGYHYLTDSSRPIYPLVNNKGAYKSAAELLKLNRQFLQAEVIAWIEEQIDKSIPPFDDDPRFRYNANLCKRDIGLILDSMIFDLKWGGSDRTVSAALKYFGAATDLGDPAVVINEQLSETVAAIRRLQMLTQFVIKNIEITELYQTLVPQVIDNAFIAESGVGGTTVNIGGISQTNPVIITTSTNHGLAEGANILINGVNGATELNGNDYFISIVATNSFEIYKDAGLTDPVSDLEIGNYTSGGVVRNAGGPAGLGGVLGDLFEAFIDVIEGSASVNLPKNNDEMDMFLANDSVRWQAITGQGHGGFMLVLDPTGQILSRSPYAQECASFSKSTGRQTFAGGMYVDGFAGNIKFQILSKDNDTFLRVGGLVRFPQLPASFIVNDTVYRINYVRDFTFNTAGSTASFVLDDTTPWPFELFTYDEDICYRDVGLIIDGLGYDIVLNTNYNTRKAALSYGQANASVVIDDQLDLTTKAITQAHLAAISAVSLYPEVISDVQYSERVITDVVRNGTVFAPTLIMDNPPGVDSNLANAKALILSNIKFIQEETIGYISATYPVFEYDDVTCRRDIGYILEGLAYDVIYGGNSQSVDSGLKYFSSITSGYPSQIPSEQKSVTLAALAYVKYLAQQVIVNAPPSSIYSSETQLTGSASDVGTQTLIGTLLDVTINIVDNGYTSAPTAVEPDLDAYAYSAAPKLARTALLDAKQSIQENVIIFVNENANIYEVLMPGNRSMLSNDFTQINDMGYGVIVNNGGLTECVSMFTYYNFISYYSLNGGQIRSVGGSSAHGVYALVAEGSDPLEVPTPVSLYYDLSQGAECYFPSGVYANIQGGQEIYVTNYTYVPLDNSEIEIDHGLGALFRYPVTTVSTSGLPAGVAKLNLKSAEGVGVDGLAQQVPNGAKLTLRQASQVVLTGDVVDVATRPSTGLVLRESPTVYRILQFQEYNDPIGERIVTISIGTITYINRTNHGLLPGYQISLSTTDQLPSGLIAGETYFVLADGYTENRFAISSTKNGTPIATTGTQAGTHSYVVKGLARTTLRENYDYVDLTVWPLQPFATSGVDTCTISVGSPAIITQANHNLSPDEVIKFEVTPGGTLPGGISPARHYFVKNVLDADTFTICTEAIPLSLEVETVDAGSGTFGVGKVIGKVGDDQIAVVPIGPGDADRILGTKFNFKGVDYTVVQYQNEAATLEAYALITLDKPLEDSAVYWTSVPTFKAAVAKDEFGTLTIRISLTRVTSHDLLEIGTGSYADTNYPSEIYGPPVNSINEANETQERDVGRVFYVTTDQFGNFSVGPYFRVDQGTGTVTFSAAIALSNLDGIGFKRGVPISEFSTDSTFSDNATDTVPTENATRTYIDRRLGLNHNGNIVPEANLIPIITGGFMSLDGQLAMKGDMNLGNNQIINLGDPTNARDAVNLQSLTFLNFQETTITGLAASDILAFTGVGNQAINATVVGDITLTINSGTNEINAQINPNAIINADVKFDAAINQSKLAMNLASTAASAPPNTPVSASSIVVGRRYRILVPGSTSWTTIGSANNLAGTIFQATAIGSGSGTAVELDSIQGGSGVSSFNSSEFTVTNGWVELQTSTSTATGLAPNKLQFINGGTVLGRLDSGPPGAVSAVTTTNAVRNGRGVQETQFNTTGLLRRRSLNYVGIDSPDWQTDFSVVEMSGGRFLIDGDYGENELVVRDSNGDFGGRNVDIARLLVDNKVTIDTVVQSLPSNSGYTQYHGYLGQVGILIGDGNGTNKVTFYDNDRHEFRTQSGLQLAPISASQVTTATLTTGGAATPGTVIGNWSLSTGSRLQATYADLAEYYESDFDYPVGTVLVFGGDKEVTVSTIEADHRVAGVVSDNAAYVMNSECPGIKSMIALQGRVACRVVGKIRKGDLIITSNIKGVAISAQGSARPGTIIGKALENYDSDHIGTIEVAVGRT